MSKDIEFIISPRSIAVVRAMNRPGSVGLAAFKDLLKDSYGGVLSHTKSLPDYPERLW